MAPGGPERIGTPRAGNAWPPDRADRADGRPLIGVNLGGSKIEIAAVAPDGAVAWRLRVPTPGAYDEILEAVAGLVAEAERATGPVAAIGIGTPGSIRPETDRVAGSNAAALNGRALDRDLSRRLSRPVLVENDANCFALAEAVAGAGRGAGAVFGAILGTGVGGGIVIGGRLWRGARAIAGEWGHTPLPAPRDGERPGPVCHCGRRGCVEAWLSGPALTRLAGEATGRRMSPPEIAAAAEAGDVSASALIAAHGERLGRALGPVVNILDPDVIVLGGGLSDLPGIASAAGAALAGHVFGTDTAPAVRRHALGASAGVIGAAWLTAAGARPGAAAR